MKKALFIALVAFLVLIGGALLNAQTAKVIALSPADAAEAKQLDNQQAALKKKKDAFEDSIRQKYLTEDVEIPTYASACITVESIGKCEPPPVKKPTPAEKKAATIRLSKTGWQNGFEYSEDFKFIVPKPYNFTPPYNGLCVGWNCNNFTTTPLIGTLN